LWLYTVQSEVLDNIALKRDPSASFPIPPNPSFAVTVSFELCITYAVATSSEKYVY
jgi:hypothetical protein